jgi:5-methylcytosine-specific restriction protein A
MERVSASPMAKHSFYGTGFWRRRRRLQLLHHPFCAMCAAKGIATAATIADHVERHRGDWTSFRTGALQSLCKHCHDSEKARIEARGYGSDIGPDGWPLDARHPANRVR